MDDNANAGTDNRFWISACLLGLMVFLIYSNTFDAAWHLDDYQNITSNPRIRIPDLSYDSLYQSTRSLTNNRVSRPLARASFALNWYGGGYNPAGFHFVNIAIHFLTAVFLYLTVQFLFQTPRLRQTSDVDAHFTALLAALLWAAHPIQTQAVTYIVQRMAAMAAMFYVLGMLLYVRGRLDKGPVWRRSLWFGGCLLSLAAGLGAKENTALLPLSLFLVEMTFFQDLASARTRRVGLVCFAAAVLLVAVGGLMIFHRVNFLTFLKGYDFRDFTLVERLLTQGRVVLLYISQIAYPVPNRLSIEHDVAVSTGLLQPWTTLPSILVILSLVALGIWQMHRRPWLSFAILFFFLNHAVESSILPLEMVFEHRNYLPSAFLFVPVAVGFQRLLRHYRDRNRQMHAGLLAFAVLLIIGLGMGTYIRNFTWATPKTLWEDAKVKAPLSNRPLHNLAWGHYERIGDTASAMALYEKALPLYRNNRSQTSIVLNNLAGLHYSRGNYRQAAEYWQTAIDRFPRYWSAYYRCAMALYRTGDQRRALDHLERALAKRPNYRDALNLKGIILIQNGAPRAGLKHFGHILRLSPGETQPLLNLGAAFALTGDFRKARLFLKTALAKEPKNGNVLVWLIETGLRSNDPLFARRYTRKLIANTPADQLSWTLSAEASDKALPLPDASAVASALAKELDRIGTALQNTLR